MFDRRPPKLIPLSDLLDEAEEPTPWLVSGLIPESELVMFHGPAHAGKTYVVLDLGLRLAFAEKDYHGFPLDGQTRPVVYVPSEGRRGVSRRIGSWLKTHADHAFDPTAYLPRTWETRIINEYGEPVRIVETDRNPEPPFYRYDADDFVLDPKRPESVETLAGFVQRLAEDFQVPPVVIVDVVSDFTPGVDENHRDFGHALRLIHPDNLAAEGGLVPTVFLVHHEGHTANGRPRGSSSVVGLVDVLIGLDYRRDGTPATLTNIRVSNPKQRNEDIFADLVLQLSKPDPGLVTPVVSGRPDPLLERMILSTWSATSVNGRKSARQEGAAEPHLHGLDPQAIDILRAAREISDSLANTDARQTDIARETGISKGTLAGRDGKLKKLEAQGFLLKTSEGGWIVQKKGLDLLESVAEFGKTG